MAGGPLDSPLGPVATGPPTEEGATVVDRSPLPLRIAVDGRVLDDRYHGIGRVTDALVRELVRVPGVQVVLALGASPTTRFDVASLLALPGVESVPFHVPLTSPRQLQAWPAALRRARVDATVFPYHLGAAVSGPGPRLVMVHDCILEAHADFAPSWRVRWAYRALTTLVVRTNRVLTPSLASARAIEHFYRLPAARIGLVPNGVDAAFGAAPGDLGATRAALGLPEHYLLQVGARRPHKNLRVLVEMLALRPDRHLVLVGNVDPRFPDAVPALAAERGVADRVHHLPFVADEHLVALYRGADAFVYPSLVEGFGLPLLEAMAAHTPVVASDIPVFAELARDAALLVPPADPGAWAEAVDRLRLDDALRAGLVAAGAATAARYTWAASAEALVGEVRRAVAGPG